MSHVRFHEAECIDSQQDHLFGFDDFWGDSVDARWHTAGNGSAAVVNGIDGGICRLTSGAVSGNSHAISWQDIRSLSAAKKAVLEAYVKLGASSVIDVRIGLYYDATHYIYFRFDDSADDTWKAVTDDGTGPTVADTGVAPDTNYHVFRIVTSSTSVTFYMDGVLVATVTADIPTEYLQPYISTATEENANKTADIDYIAWRQDI